MANENKLLNLGEVK